MLEPNKKARSAQSLGDKKYPKKYCENPACHALIPQYKARKGAKYCDNVCHREAVRIAGMERRPADLRCANCNAQIDTTKNNPAYYEKSEVFYCNAMCLDEHRRKTGFYKEISAKGAAEVRYYKEKHGHVHNHEGRARAVSQNNKTAHPKSKYFDRAGKVWGYDVVFKGGDDEYTVSVPDLPELGEMQSKTVKGGLLLIREKIIEIRAQQRAQQRADEQEQS